MPVVAALADAVVHGHRRTPPSRGGATRSRGGASGPSPTSWSETPWPMNVVVGGSARRRVAGVRLIASDVDWSAGEGAEVHRPVRGNPPGALRAAPSLPMSSPARARTLLRSRLDVVRLLSDPRLSGESLNFSGHATRREVQRVALTKSVSSGRARKRAPRIRAAVAVGSSRSAQPIRMQTQPVSCADALLALLLPAGRSRPADSPSRRCSLVLDPPVELDEHAELGPGEVHAAP